MQMALLMVFDDNRGIECSKCMLSTSKNGTYICTGLGIRPTCSAEGRRKDCPLIPVGEEE